MKTIIENWQASLFVAAAVVFAAWFVWDQVSALFWGLVSPITAFLSWRKLKRTEADLATMQDEARK